MSLQGYPIFPHATFCAAQASAASRAQNRFWNYTPQKTTNKTSCKARKNGDLRRATSASSCKSLEHPVSSEGFGYCGLGFITFMALAYVFEVVVGC